MTNDWTTNDTNGTVYGTSKCETHGAPCSGAQSVELADLGSDAMAMTPSFIQQRLRHSELTLRIRENPLNLKSPAEYGPSGSCG